MGMADIAEVLWNDYLIHNPANPSWVDRDRFVLSNGHASMLLYSLPGVETTTGPLGQGLANAVGMAMAERALAAYFNRDGHTIVDHYTHVFARTASSHGVRKVNIDTDLRLASTGAVRKFLAENPKEFDPRKFLKVATQAMKQICVARYEAFGCAGQASRIRPLTLESMSQRYQAGELEPRVH